MTDGPGHWCCCFSFVQTVDILGAQILAFHLSSPTSNVKATEVRFLVTSLSLYVTQKCQGAGQGGGQGKSNRRFISMESKAECLRLKEPWNVLGVISLGFGHLTLFPMGPFAIKGCNVV